MIWSRKNGQSTEKQSTGLKIDCHLSSKNAKNSLVATFPLNKDFLPLSLSNHCTFDLGYKNNIHNCSIDNL